MKIIVGLGNPGKEYQATRHNFGFMVLDSLAEGQGTSFKLNNKFEAEVAELEFDNQKAILVKPQTYMNNSGRSVSKLLKFYKATLDDLLLIYDDKDLVFGTQKTTGKSSAGHKGVESIIKELGSENISRIRLGINNNSVVPTESFVLQKFTPKELTEIDDQLGRANEEIFLWLEQ
jgi:PTH1 family peptidyl-tRNA hydrolase